MTHYEAWPVNHTTSNSSYTLYSAGTTNCSTCVAWDGTDSNWTWTRTPATWYKVNSSAYTDCDGELVQRAVKYVNRKLQDTWTWYGTNYTYGTGANTYTSSGWFTVAPEDPAEVRRRRLRDAIRSRSRPFAIRTGKKPVGVADDLREQRARDTLRSLIGEPKYRLFLTSGFISVRSPRSGRVYQIFPGHGITRVYQGGQLLERLCVVLKGDFPPTDSLIVRYLMILNNEEDFRARAVQHGIKGLQEDRVAAQDGRTLLEIAADYSGARRLVG